MHLIYNKRKFLLYVAPMAIFFAAYTFVPILISFSYSLTSFRGLGDFSFIGLNNYVRLFRDKVFWLAVGNTFKLAAATLIVVLPVSFFLALAVNHSCKRNTVYKAIFFAPYTIGGIIVGLVWSFTLDPSTGLLNNVLRSIGWNSLALEWIGGPTLTPYVVGVVGSWSAAGFCMLLWMTGIKAIPTDVIEASVIDGASKWQQITHVFLPLLRNSLKMIFILQLTGALKTFDSVYVLTGGGPNHLSETMVSYMYVKTFTSRLFSYGMAMAVVEFLFALTISLVALYLTRGEVAE